MKSPVLFLSQISTKKIYMQLGFSLKMNLLDKRQKFETKAICDQQIL